MWCDWLLLCLPTELLQLVLTMWCWSGDVKWCDWLLLCLMTELHQFVLTVWCWSGDVV